MNDLLKLIQDCESRAVELVEVAGYLSRKADIVAFSDLAISLGGTERQLISCMKLRSKIESEEVEILHKDDNYVRLISIFDNISFEEAVFILTERIDAELLSEYTASTGFEYVKQLDEKLESAITQNIGSFRDAVNAIVRNRGIKYNGAKILPRAYQVVIDFVNSVELR